MDDTFGVRLDQVFGPSSSSLWRVEDEEIERIEWNREKEDTGEVETDSFSLQKGIFISHREKSQEDLDFELEKDLDELDDDSDSGAASSQLGKPKPDDYDDEAWEIKNSIGMDCTLDYEEEEDQFDKVAVGKETEDDRMYMKCAFNYDNIDMDCNNVLPSSLKDIPRDPRANHMAAKLRLKEDEEAAKKMNSLQGISKQDSSTAIVDDQVKASDDGNLKSILKRREDDSDSKSRNDQSDSKSQKKRVRFDPECTDGFDEDSDEVMEIDSTDESLVYTLPPDYPSGIPDYMRNPSKYTHYTFDSSNDVDEQSNTQACMDFLNMLKKSDNTESQDDASGDIPKSLTFIPKKKVVDEVMMNNLPDTKQKEDNATKESLNKKGLLVSIVATDTEESEIRTMEEDEKETAADRKSSSEWRSRIRTKPRLETDESV